DDAAPAVNPGAAEVCNGIDDDCDGTADDGLPFVDYYLDADADGHGRGDGAYVMATCDGAPEGYAPLGDDCDDADAANFPGNPEVCDDADNDCDAVPDDGLVFVDYWPDADNDGHGGYGTPVAACDGAPEGYAPVYDDCNDANPAIHPGATEVCNGIDDDCDDVPDDGLVFVDYYPDADNDGHGGYGTPVAACDGAPGGYVAVADDCDDTNPDVHPGAVDVCNGIDDDCDDLVDEEDVDADLDHWKTCDGDCDDADPAVNPGAPEQCDQRDNDCDGVVDEGFDADGNGVGDSVWVDANWGGPQNGTSDEPFTTIQQALAAFGTCPEILVRPGDYSGPLDFLEGTDVAVRSTHGPSETDIFASDYGWLVRFGRDGRVVAELSGFNIVGAIGTETEGVIGIFGGSDVAFTNNVLVRNDGGGNAIVDVSGAGPGTLIEANDFNSNIVTYVAPVRVRTSPGIAVAYNYFHGNSTQVYGGVYVEESDDVRVIGNKFETQSANMVDVLVYHSSGVDVSRNEFQSGAEYPLYGYEASGFFYENQIHGMDTILGNLLYSGTWDAGDNYWYNNVGEGRAWQVQGGVDLMLVRERFYDNVFSEGLVRVSASGVDVSILNMLAHNNDCGMAGCVWTNDAEGTIEVINSTFAYNSQDPMYVGQVSFMSEIVTGRVWNSLFIGNTYAYGIATYVPIDEGWNDFYANSYGAMAGQTPAATDLAVDPLFANVGINDYHLQSTSPVKDKGNPDGGLNDPDGSRNDMGAYGGPYGSW
ncbi:putative metal-binding motif-containing protein, partial [Myxococcota bacterium]|nr:putative metal-binding motif-containing protein [Myxococcota bacterium]